MEWFRGWHRERLRERGVDPHNCRHERVGDFSWGEVVCMDCFATISNRRSLGRTEGLWFAALMGYLGRWRR